MPFSWFGWEAVLAVLVELAVVEQRYRAVMEVLNDGDPVTEVAARFGVARQTLHAWLRRYAAPGGMANLADRSSRPSSCPHQMSPETESRVLALRLDHPGWGPDRIVYELAKQLPADRMPGGTSVYRALATLRRATLRLSGPLRHGRRGCRGGWTRPGRSSWPSTPTGSARRSPAGRSRSS